MMLRILSVFLFLASVGCTVRKPPPATPDGAGGNPLQALLSAHPHYFDTLLRNNDLWKIQIRYTQIDRDADNRPRFTDHDLAIDSGYFYPASTVKMPVAFLALEWVQRANEALRAANRHPSTELIFSELDRESTLITGKGQAWQTPVFNDPSASDGRPSVGHYIRKIFLVSDNDAFNRLYELMGQEHINRRLRELGFPRAEIRHRLSLPLTEAQNRQTNPARFFDTAGRLILEHPSQVSDFTFPQRNSKLGKGYMSRGKLVPEPFDFSTKNRFPLSELHECLKRVLFPEVFPDSLRFRISEEDYRFLYRYMSMMPRESDYPNYDTTHHPDAYVKFLLFGGDGPIRDSSIRIFNKVGDAYGFLTDVAYIVDFERGIEFLLSATIACNSDGIFNDDKYDYNRVGFPFLKHLGEVVYEYEKGRKRTVRPDLSKFRLFGR